MDNRGINFIFFFSLGIHILDALSGFRNTGLRLFFYITLAFVAWAAIFREEGGVLDVKDLLIPLLLSSIAFFVPYLIYRIPYTAALLILQTIIVFLPVWTIYLVFFIGGTKLLGFMRYAIIIFWIIVLVPVFAINLSADLGLADINTGIDVGRIGSSTWSTVKYNSMMLLDNIREAVMFIPNTIQDMIDYGTGRKLPADEETTREPVGVYIESMSGSSPRFFPDEEANIFAVVRARTLEDEIGIELSCYFKDSDKKRYGTTDPEEATVLSMDEIPVTCTFAPRTLPDGKRDAFINAVFSFSTQAMLKKDFISWEERRALEMQGVNIYDRFKISTVEPITIFTQGPMRIALLAGTKNTLGGTENPLGVSASPRNFPFEIHLSNNWLGKVNNVTHIEVSLPQGIELRRCDHEFEYSGTGQNYVFSSSAYKKIGEISGRSSNIIYCTISASDIGTILGQSPHAERTFTVNARYFYEIEEKIPIEIIKAREYLEPDTALTSAGRINELMRAVEEKGKDEACSEITSCSVYSTRAAYDSLGFNEQEWCDADPCGLGCYSDFSKSNQDVSFNRCDSCEDLSRILGLRQSQDHCKYYNIMQQCNQDPCSFDNCVWHETQGCIRSSADDESQTGTAAPTGGPFSIDLRGTTDERLRHSNGIIGRASRNNNPGNIKTREDGLVGPPSNYGIVGYDGNFTIFNTLDNGFAYLVYFAKRRQEYGTPNYPKGRTTLWSFIDKYANKDHSHGAYTFLRERGYSDTILIEQIPLKDFVQALSFGEDHLLYAYLVERGFFADSNFQIFERMADNMLNWRLGTEQIPSGP